MQAEELAVLKMLAYVYLRNGSAGRAEILYGALLTLDPHDVQAAAGRAWARLAADKCEAALEALDAIAAPSRGHADVQLLRARALARLDRLEEAGAAMRDFVGALRADLPASAS